MAFDNNDYIWEGQILSRRPAIIELLAEDELVDEIQEGSCVWPCEWVRVWCDGVDQGCDEVVNDCDEQIEEVVGDDWSSCGDYDFSPFPTDEENEEKQHKIIWIQATLESIMEYIGAECQWGLAPRTGVE